MSRLHGGNALRIAMGGVPIMRILVTLTIFVNVNCQEKFKEIDFVCPEGTTGNGNFADPVTCRRFYQIPRVIRANFAPLNHNQNIPGSHYAPYLITPTLSKQASFRLTGLMKDCRNVIAFTAEEFIEKSNRYLIHEKCVDGYSYLNRCPSGLYFDDISKFCTFKVEARCGPIATTPAPITETPLDLAKKCEPSECELPQCFCSKDGTIIPGGLDPEDTPQMIMLTFDGAVNLNNFELYKKVFDDVKNPNGCPIRGTYFLSHEYSNYAMVQTLAHEGHEIAAGTISQQQGLQDKGYEEWAGEMIGMREILKKFANVTRGDVIGARAPFLKPGRNTQFKVLEDFGFVYDSSIGVPPSPVPVWPYTLDYKIPHECKVDTCPTKTFPGLWEIPFNAHYVASFEGGHCPYLDQCVLHNHDADDVLDWLQEDFKRHYEQNRAPYMMPFHTNWFQIKALERGLHKFLRWASELPDVWFLTMTQALTWITEPQTNKAMSNKYEAWRCDKELPKAPCNLPNKCALSFKHPDQNFTDTRYMESCSECPKKYPWLGDSGGTGIPGKDNYLPDNYDRK